MQLAGCALPAVWRLLSQQRSLHKVWRCSLSALWSPCSPDALCMLVCLCVIKCVLSSAAQNSTMITQSMSAGFLLGMQIAC
jgi:hypothetical protein